MMATSISLSTTGGINARCTPHCTIISLTISARNKKLESVSLKINYFDLIRVYNVSNNLVELLRQEGGPH